MAVSGEAPVELVSTVPQGTPVVDVHSRYVGSIYETVELTSDSEPESVVEVGGHGIGFDANRREVSPTPIFPAVDLRLRLSDREMTRHVAERRVAVPKRKRRPDHAIHIPIRPPQPTPLITISPKRIPVITITTDRVQSPFCSIPAQKTFSERYSRQGCVFERSSFSTPPHSYQ